MKKDRSFMIFIATALVCLVLAISFWAAVIYIAWHFIAKWW